MFYLNLSLLQLSAYLSLLFITILPYFYFPSRPFSPNSNFSFSLAFSFIPILPSLWCTHQHNDSADGAAKDSHNKHHNDSADGAAKDSHHKHHNDSADGAAKD